MTKLLTFLLAAVLFCSCKSTGGGFGSSVMLDAQFQSTPASVPVAWVRGDLVKVVIARTQADGFIRLIDRTTWLPLPYMLQFTAGKIVVINRDIDFKQVLDLGDPLPSWCAEWFSPAELTVSGGVVSAPSFGITFAPPAP